MRNGKDRLMFSIAVIGAILLAALLVSTEVTVVNPASVIAAALKGN